MAAAEGRTLLIPSRAIDFPTTISKEALDSLIAAYGRPGAKNPPHTDKALWKKEIASFNEKVEPLAQASLSAHLEKAKIYKKKSAQALYYKIVPKKQNTSPKHAIIALHGGGLVRLTGTPVAAFGAEVALNCECTTYASDYRMPPDHPYPAAIDDIVSLYQQLLLNYESSNIAILGSSAGGNLAAAATLKIRDAGIAMPGAVILLSPELDLTESGDTFQTNLHLDATLKGSLMEANLLYANGANLRTPYVSPLFGDFSKGFPRTFIQAGTRDLFLSNAVRMHRNLRTAGIPSELHVWEAMPHGGFPGTDVPENKEINQEIRNFLNWN